jgi:hypothetical protein
MAPMNFIKYVETLPLVSCHLLQQLEFVPGGERALRECLKDNRQLKVASDGSFDPDEELASFGWLLIGIGNVLVHGAGPVDSILNHLSSTRAELFGIGATTEFLYHSCEFYEIESMSQVTNCCDNRAVISRINETLWKYLKQ